MPKAYEVKVRDPAHSGISKNNHNMCGILAHSTARLCLAGMGGSFLNKFYSPKGSKIYRILLINLTN
ncbi:MAG: hypothetical protein AUK09_00925 [Parcubacteria group bacterium CG2_30_36_38]|nr:MAG: hypothetical protein AUK09_00925 [Parcubacteria group bacterium CG2_30_36_38]PIZ90307.1 MAG: hypothetical protein COX87_01200 [bacterium (Candidatus Moisslbacteria) CG_4_10_14_0_2_um_filter_36_61]PJC00862.1 MAG: hypothetical protein CO074_00315 [bacterium (Candidatus Moisslbacteria) CG_4_9_14_0_8_um_filter_36_20]